MESSLVHRLFRWKIDAGDCRVPIASGLAMDRDADTRGMNAGLLPRSEDKAADAYHRGAFFNGCLVAVRHAHGEFGEFCAGQV